jgi:plasmid stabilization system protein ParE
VNRSVRLSDSAEEDILRNAVWWADNHSIDEAIEWEAIVRRQLLEIPCQPDSHSLLSESRELKYVIREALIGKGQKGSYGAVFFMSGDKVVVLRLLRASQQAIRPEELPKEFN